MYLREEVEFSDKLIYRDKRDLLMIVKVPFEGEQRYVPLFQKRGEM